MRGRKKISRSQGRRHRRCILAGLLVASGQVALADSPVMIAPLPLVPASGQAGECMQMNPFCLPLAAAQEGPVLVELPAGDEPQQQVTTASRWPGIVRTLKNGQPGIVQLTPLVPLDGESRVVQSSGRQDAVLISDTDEGGVRFRIEESMQPMGGGVRSNPLVRDVPVPISDVQGVKPLVVASDPTPSSGAISFSFSDEETAPLETTPPRRTLPSVVRESTKPLLAEIGSPRQSAPKRSGWSDAHAAASDPGPTLARPSAAGRTILVPIDDRDAQVVSAVGRERHAQAPQANSNQARLVNGARPKVEVGRPPLVIQRGRSLSVTLQPEPIADDAVPIVLAEDTDAQPGNPIAQAETRDTPEIDAAEAITAIPDPPLKANLHFKPTEVRALKIEHAIHRVEIDSAAVCAAIKTSPHQVQLIATGPGTTKLILWTVDQAGNEQRERYEIHVADIQTAQADDVQSIAATLTQSVGAAFPTSNIQVGYRSGRLVVTGTCDDEGSARRILRMVRSACPMPVDDKVVVR